MTTEPDDKTTALRHARRLAERAERLDRERKGTILLCQATGASLREIAEATGIPHNTVKRMIDREKVAQPS